MTVNSPELIAQFDEELESRRREALAKYRNILARCEAPGADDPRFLIPILEVLKLSKSEFETDCRCIQQMRILTEQKSELERRIPKLQWVVEQQRPGRTSDSSIAREHSNLAEAKSTLEKTIQSIQLMRDQHPRLFS